MLLIMTLSVLLKSHISKVTQLQEECECSQSFSYPHRLSWAAEAPLLKGQRKVPNAAQYAYYYDLW